MTHDEDIGIEVTPEGAQPERNSGRRLVIAGVVGACALGVGLGLWARPAAHEQQFAIAPKADPKPDPVPARVLEIVVDDTPAPIGSLMDVMPLGVAGAAAAAAPAPSLPMAPRPSPTGLMKVDTPVIVETPPPVVKPVLKVVEAAPEPPKPVVKAKPKSKSEPKPKAEAKVARKAEKAPTKVAKADKPKRKVEKTKIAKAEPKPKKAAKTEVAEKQKPNRLTRLARAVKATPAKVEKKLAKAEKPAKAKGETRKERLARLNAERKKTQLAEAKARKLQLAKAEAKKPKKKPEPRGTGPMRVAKADRCASADPGEAIVCADARLSSRDRQMQVAYRNAEASGVPASALRRQQQRWVQARAAAAREAPWAVEDVYQARIAELNDLARDAAGPY